MTPRYATRTPTRGGTSFQRFRADSPELSNEEQAFWNYATLPPLESEWDAERLMPHDEYRVLSKATSGGGFLVPTDLAAKTIAASRAASTVAGLATEYVTTGGETLNISLDATLGSAAWLAESGGYAPVDDTITQQPLNAFKSTTKIIVSEELSTDEAVSLDFLAQQFGYRLGSLQEAAFSTGDGTGKPMGVVTAGNGITVVNAATGSSTLCKVADLQTVFLALPAAYRATASWLIAADDFGKLAGTTDSAGAFALPSLQFDRRAFSAGPSTSAATCPPPLLRRRASSSGTSSSPTASAASTAFRSSVRTNCTVTRARSVFADGAVSMAES